MNPFLDRRSPGLEELPDLFVSGRYGKPDFDIVELHQDLDVPQDQGRFGLNGHGPLVFQENLETFSRQPVLLLCRLIGIADAADPDPARPLFPDLSGQQLRRIDLDFDEHAPFFPVARKPLHEGGIAIPAGVAAPHVGIDDIVVDLGLGKDGFCGYLSDDHSYAAAGGSEARLAGCRPVICARLCDPWVRKAGTWKMASGTLPSD